MPWSFWASYLLKLGIAGALLGALYAVARAFRRMRCCVGANRRITVMETALLSQHCAIYLLNVGTRYFLVGTTAAGVATLAELAAAELESAEAMRKAC